MNKEKFMQRLSEIPECPADEIDIAMIKEAGKINDGSLADAAEVFDDLIIRDLIAQGLHGDGLKAALIEERRKIRPAVETLIAEADELAKSGQPIDIGEFFGTAETQKSRIEHVAALDGFRLSVRFACGITKIYDMTPLADKIPCFLALSGNENLFRSVKVDVGGRGVIWNDYLDLSCDELWENGICLNN